MDFPPIDLMDQDACYQRLVRLLHPAGLACPACQVPDHLRVHRRHRAPVLDYRCAARGRVFNAFTGTDLEGTHRRPAEVMLIRPSRDVSKWFELRYVAMFPWGHNIKEVTDKFRGFMLGLRTHAEFAS